MAVEGVSSGGMPERSKQCDRRSGGLLQRLRGVIPLSTSSSRGSSHPQPGNIPTCILLPDSGQSCDRFQQGCQFREENTIRLRPAERARQDKVCKVESLNYVRPQLSAAVPYARKANHW